MKDGTMIRYFYDSYTIFEFIGSNRRYAKCFLKTDGITIRLQLMEIFYRVLKQFGEEKAETVYNALFPKTEDLDDEVIEEAMKTKILLRKQGKNVSYSDAIGYPLARKNKIRFLTGDVEFKGMKGGAWMR